MPGSGLLDEFDCFPGQHFRIVFDQKETGIRIRFMWLALSTGDLVVKILGIKALRAEIF